MKKTYLTVIALFAGACSAYSSVQITNSSFNGDTFTYATVVNNAGTLMPAGGGYAAIGSFAIDPAGLANPAALAASFTAFASSTFGGADALNANGSYSFGANIPNPTPAAVPGGQAIYVVYGNAATLAGSSQFAVVNINRPFPANPSDPGIVAYTTDLVANLASGTVVHGSLVPLVASPILDGAGLTKGNQSLRLAVPEPGVSLLSLGSIALLLIRRRRS